MNTDPNGRTLPRGVTYEPKRRRYRVRLYQLDRPVWVSYSRSYADAMDQYDQARQRQRSLRASPRGAPRIRGHWTALRRRLRRAWRGSVR
jgi:hypothetical protein